VTLLALALLAGVTFGQPQAVSVSYYHPALEGLATASGAPYDPQGWTAASNDYPLGTRLVVCFDRECTLVMVNDRMVKELHLTLDLTEAAFMRLAPLSRGRLEGVAMEVRR